MDEIRSVCLSLVAEDGAEREREVNRGVTKREDGVDSSSESRSHRGFVGVNSRICFPQYSINMLVGAAVFLSL